MPEYKAAYNVGSAVRVLDRDDLEAFAASWKYHHPVVPEQLRYAGRVSRVKSIGYYHGGDPLYELDDIPGMWHEACLLQV